jgi:hypothetical protein
VKNVGVLAKYRTGAEDRTQAPLALFIGLSAGPACFGIIGKPDASATFATREYHHSREPWEQVCLSAMRADFSATVKREFHFREGSFQLDSSDGPEHSPTLIANNVGFVAFNYSIEHTAAVRIAKTRMRNEGCGHTLDARTVAYGAITGSC